VPFVRDHSISNLTETSAYPLVLYLSLPITSPVPHAGLHPPAPARARAPMHLVPVGPPWDPLAAMDCSEDAQRGVDSKGSSPSSPPDTLFTQHDEEAVQEPHTRCAAAADLPATQMLTCDHVNPTHTHHPCPRPSGVTVVATGTTWATGQGLAVEAALEGPTRIGDDYPRDVGCPSGGDYPACNDGLADTPPPPMFPPHALPDEWLDVFAKLAVFPRLPNPDNVGAHPSTLLGCGSFSECVRQSRVHAVNRWCGHIPISFFTSLICVIESVKWSEYIARNS